MDLDFGLLQQINADIDGFPVRLDEDMDLLDFDNAFHGPVPGSFQDFANWLADTSGTVASTRNPESTQPNATCQDQSDTVNHSLVFQQQLAPSKADASCPTVSEHMYQQQMAQHAISLQQQQQQPGLRLSVPAASGHPDVMRQNSTHSVHSQHSQPSPAGHRPPSPHNSFISQHSCSSGAGLPDATLLLQQEMQQQQQQQQMQAQQAQVKQEQQQMQQQQAAVSAALSAAAGKAQQLLMSASSGFQTPAASHAAAATATAGFLAQPPCLGGHFGGQFAPAGFGAISPQGGGVLLSPQGAVLQPTLLIGGGGGGGGSAHQAAAMAAMHNPFAAAAAGMPGFSAQGMQGMGIALGIGGSASLGHMQGIALHNSALHSLVGHGVLKHTAVDRQQKARKRNTVASLEVELSEKLGQLQLLSAENEMLKLRAGVLEATVQNREDQMRVVWEHGPPTFPIDCPDGSPKPGQQQQQQQVDDSGQPGEGASEQQQQKGLGIAIGNGSSAKLATMWDEQPVAAAGSTAAAAAAAAAPAGPQMPTTPSAKAEPATSSAGAARTASNCSNGSAAAGPAGTVVDSPSSSSVCEGSGGSAETASTFDAHTALLPLQQQKDSLLSIKRMTDVDVIRHWKQFLQEVTSALVQLQREESAAAATAPGGSNAQQQQHEASSPESAVVSPAEQRVRDLVDKYCYLVRTSQTLNPSAYCRLFGRHLDTGETLPYNDNHWRNVVAVLGLSKDQVTHILACAELYFSSRAKLQAEQRALQAQLKAAELSPLDLLGGDADNPLRPWLERLGSNLKREHNLRIMLNSYVWGRIFTHVQKAKAAVYSHPLYVDIHALVCVMCEDALAAAGAPRGTNGSSAAATAQQQQQQHLQQQQQFAAAYAACQQQHQQHQQQQQQLAGYMQYMSGHIQHSMM